VKEEERALPLQIMRPDSFGARESAGSAGPSSFSEAPVKGGIAGLEVLPVP
jgi:hypothetical protein